MRERDAGRERGTEGGREGGAEHTPRTVCAEQTDRWVKDCGGAERAGGGLAEESVARLKGLPLLGTEGTGRLWPPSSEGREGQGDALTAVLEYISPS